MKLMPSLKIIKKNRQVTELQYQITYIRRKDIEKKIRPKRQLEHREKQTKLKKEDKKL